ncbi:MAG TPA: Wzt carbohydrate-binding domain-containing protein, partial [Burkholderiaceae bacterium]|nr:Wzt carbohydrate-binding domain-containing protein [Burkholderiaceae bacterium]
AFKPDLLIVDEALSVGDSYFQHKSFDRMRRFREEGTSIMLVSHSMGDVKSLCDRAILLDQGRVVREGSPEEVVDYYNALIAEKENSQLTIEQKRAKHGWVTTRSGSFEVMVEHLGFHDPQTGKSLEMLRVGNEVELVLEAVVHTDIDRLVLGYMIRDRQGHIVWGTNTWHTRQVLTDLRAGDRVRFVLPFRCSLGPGSYSVSPALVSSDTHLENNYEWTDNMLVFDVLNLDQPVFIGTNWIDAEFEISRTRMDAEQA